MEVKKLGKKDFTEWTNALVSQVMTVFAEAPWNEHRKCAICGKRWGKQERIPFFHCHRVVVPFWKRGKIEGMFTEAVHHPKGVLFSLSEERKYQRWNGLSTGWNHEFIPPSEVEGTFLFGFAWGFIEKPNEVRKRVDDKGLLFFSEVSQETSIGYLSAIGVGKDERRNGNAKKLFSAWENFCVENKANYMVLRTHTSSAMYVWMIKSGFEVIETYEKEGQPWRVVMVKKIR